MGAEGIWGDPLRVRGGQDGEGALRQRGGLSGADRDRGRSAGEGAVGTWGGRPRGPNEKLGHVSGGAGESGGGPGWGWKRVCDRGTFLLLLQAFTARSCSLPWDGLLAITL